MAKHLVKCLYCGETFDISVEPFEKPRVNRYAHTKCFKEHQTQKTQEEIDYDNLVIYLKQLFGKPGQKVWRQLKQYKEEYNYTYSGIHKTLIWWYEIKHNNIEDANGGIGIVPYIYEDATKYYYALYLAQLMNQEKDIEHYEAPVREFCIQIPESKPRLPRLFRIHNEGESE